MTEILNYPLPSGPLDGSEFALGFSGGKTRRIPTSALSALATSALAQDTGAGQIGTESGVTGEQAFSIGTSNDTEKSFEYYGYAGASTDDAAFADMCEDQAARGSIHRYFTPRDHVIGASKTLSGVGINLRSVVARRARLIVENDAQILINPALLDEHLGGMVSIDGIVFATSGGIHPSGALKIVYPANAIGSTAQPLNILNCDWVGVLDTDGFTTACELRNAPNPYILNPRFYGDRRSFSGPLQSGTCLAFTADNGNAGGNAIVYGLQAYWANQACQITGHHEGMRALEWTVVGTRAGLTQIGASGGNPLLQVRGGFWNCSTIGIYAKNMIHVDIDNPTIYCEGIPGDTTPSGFTAIVLQSVDALAMGGKVRAGIDMVTGAAPSRTALSVVGSTSGGTTDVKIDIEAKGAGGGSTGIFLDAHTSRTRVLGSCDFNGLTTTVQDNGTNNTVEAYRTV